MPSVGKIRLGPRPRSRLTWRSSGPREVDEERMLPNPPLPICERKNNARKGSDQPRIPCTIDSIDIIDIISHPQLGCTAQRL